MAWALHRTEKEKPAAGKTDYWRDFWRSGWDSNPRNLAVQLISSQSRYDHFDTAPYLSQHQHLGKRGELMGRTSKNIKLRIPEKPHKIKGFRSGSYRVATPISSQPRYDHFDTAAYSVRCYQPNYYAITFCVLQGLFLHSGHILLRMKTVYLSVRLKNYEKVLSLAGAALAEVPERADALLLPGGGDMHPRFYGQAINRYRRGARRARACAHRRFSSHRASGHRHLPRAASPQRLFRRHAAPAYRRPQPNQRT